MSFFSARWLRVRRCAELLLLSALGVGCLQEPAPNLRFGAEKKASEEVFRVFCRRVAKDVYPLEASGSRFVPMCDGETDVPSTENARLRTLIGRRDNIVAALDQVFGETDLEGEEKYDDNELGGFLAKLVPLYDLPNERIPRATRNIANLLVKLIDDNDERAKQVVETVARLSARSGYRPPELVLGAVRPILSYDGFDTLVDKLLTVVAEGGSAHQEWMNLLAALALELADDVPADRPAPADSTLRTALALLLKTDASLAGDSGPLPVLQRDDEGNASVAEGQTGDVTPFLVVNRPDSAEDRNGDTLAMAGGKPVYETFDANQTILAASMRETSRLIARGDDERSGLENIAHGIKPLLGPWGDRTFKIGQNDHAFQGPDLDNSPMLEFVHALLSLARYPETEVLLKVLKTLVEKHETEAIGADYLALAIDKLSDGYPNAKLNGPHEFWDDMIQAGDRMLTRDNLIERLIRSFTDPAAALQGKLFANWMTFKDQVTYENAPITPSGPNGTYSESEKESINKLVEHTYSEKVERTPGADVGMNRSVWQRTMSLINSLNGVQVCTKDNSALRVPTSLGIEFVFPASAAAGGPGYKPCELIEINDALEIYGLAVLGKGKIVIKDELANGLGALGSAIGVVGTVPDIQEKESQLTGFRDTLTALSTARFLFAPRNKFLSDLFSPQLTRDGVPVNEYEPYGLFPMEVKDPDAGGKSFLEVGVPLVQAFDDAETRDAAGKLPDGYMFGNLLSVFHKHWPSRKAGPCPVPVVPGNEGCTQSDDPAAPFYVPGSNVVSYEELLAESLRTEDMVEILHRATLALADIKVMNKDNVEIDGIKALSDFATVMLTPDPTLKTRAGKASTKTNLCVEAGGACQNDVGRIIPVYTPLYLVLDAIKQIDNTWEKPENKQLHESWLAGRSKLVDLLLTAKRSGTPDAYQYALEDRSAYAILLAALPWVSEQIAAHRSKNDLVDWSDNLSTRLGKVLRHPLLAAGVGLLEKFWDEPEASGEFIKVSASVLDEANNPKAFRGMLVAAADLLTLLDKDQNLSPAIQFASLAIAPNAFTALDSQEAPAVGEGALYAGTELARDVIQLLLTDDKEGFTTLAKLLRNSVLSNGSARSPVEELIDITADVNRIHVDQPTEVSLTAEEDRKVFDDVKGFLYDSDDEKRSLERLYHVIQSRKLAGRTDP